MTKDNLAGLGVQGSVWTSAIAPIDPIWALKLCKGGFSAGQRKYVSNIKHPKCRNIPGLYLGPNGVNYS